MRRTMWSALVVGLLIFQGASALAHPPNTVLRSGEVRQEGNVRRYCWLHSNDDNYDCHGRDRHDFPSGVEAVGGRRARIRIKRDQGLDKPVGLRAWRHVDRRDKQPNGLGWSVPHHVEERTWGDRTVYDVVFRLPKYEGHLYLLFGAAWEHHEKYGRGNALYNYHLKLR